MPARRKSGFTLIELLVVIAIIAILAAILFPVFARAREAARKATCQNNMKECAIALQQYWNDYDATIPSSKIGGTNTDPVKFMSTVGYLPPSSAPATASQTWAMVLYDHMGKNKDIMFCPSDSVDRNNADAAAGAASNISFYWKCAVDRAWIGTPTVPPAQKEGDFAYNADQIVFYEAAGFHSGSQGGLRNEVQINVAYFDSHVKNVSLTHCVAATDTAIKNPILEWEPMFWNYDNEPGGTLAPKTFQPASTAIDPRRYSDKL